MGTKQTHAPIVRFMHHFIHVVLFLQLLGLSLIVKHDFLNRFDSGRVQVPVHFTLRTESLSETGTVQVKFTGHPGEVTIYDHYPLTIRLCFGLLRYLGFGLIVYATLIIRKVIVSLRQGDPFTRENGRHLRRIALVIIAIAAVKSFNHSLGHWLVLKELSFGEIWIKRTLDIDLSIVFLGLLILLIAEIFYTGAEMSDEQKLTI